MGDHHAGQFLRHSAAKRRHTAHQHIGGRIVHHKAEMSVQSGLLVPGKMLATG